MKHTLTKKVILSSFLLSLISPFYVHETQAEVLDHSILHKDGSVTPPNVTPHKDIAEIEQPMELRDATNEQKNNKDTKTEGTLEHKTTDKAQATTKNELHSNEIKQDHTNANLINQETKSNVPQPNHYEHKEDMDINKTTEKQKQDKVLLPSTGVKENGFSIFMATVFLMMGSALLFKSIRSYLFIK